MQNKNDPGAYKIGKQLESIILPYQILKLSDRADMMIDLRKTNGKGIALDLVDASDSIRWNRIILKGDSISKGDAIELLSVIKNSMRVKYLRTMPDGGELLQYITARITYSNPASEINESILGPDDDYSLQLVNSSGEKLFYTVLDITPDNQVKILYPSPEGLPADYLIEKNATVTRDLRVSRNTPLGKEFLKIIVSKEPMDLRSVLEHTIRRSEMCSFQAVLDDLFTDTNLAQTTRGDINTIKAEEVGIVTRGFTVRSK
jgi:hypothetical protein